MKTLRNVLTTALLMIAAVTMTMASNGFDLIVNAKKDKSLAVHVESKDQQEIKIQIKDEGGRILHEEKAPYNVLNKKVFNLKNLVPGNYTVVARDEVVTYVQPIQVGEDVVTVDPTQRTQYFKPFIQETAGFVDVSMLTLGKGVQASIQVEDQFGETIYYLMVEDVTPLEKRLNLNQLPTGNYNIAVAVSGTNIYDVYNKNVFVGPAVASK